MISWSACVSVVPILWPSPKSPRSVPSLKRELVDDVEITPNADQEQCDFLIELLHGLSVVNVDTVS